MYVTKKKILKKIIPVSLIIPQSSVLFTEIHLILLYLAALKKFKL